MENEILLLVLSSMLLAGCMHEPQEKGYKVVRVIDGDTIIVQKDNINETIRILGIDFIDLRKDKLNIWLSETNGSKERITKCYKEGNEFVKELIINEKVILLVDEGVEPLVDRYDRKLRYIEFEDGDIRYDVGEELIKRGYARMFDPSPGLCSRCEGYRTLQVTTKESGNGCLWSN